MSYGMKKLLIMLPVKLNVNRLNQGWGGITEKSKM